MAELSQAQQDKVRRDQAAYRLCFGSPAGGEVLVDLQDFCRANESTVVADLNGTIDYAKTLILQGRREVWLRIQRRLNLTPQALAQLYERVPIIVGENDNG